MKEHLKAKAGHVLKFISFLTKNNDAPYHIKKTVWESALQSALFYSCETWLACDLRTAETVYMSTLKQLLGVRPTTCNDITLIEANVGKAKSYIQQRQLNFVCKMQGRDDFANSYIGQVMSLAIQKKTPAGLVLQNLVNHGANRSYVTTCLTATKDVVNVSESSRRVSYKLMNPELSLCSIYESTSQIPEYTRIACTRMRLSSHYLKIETGRWARLAIEDRLCLCGKVQNEEHVMLECPLTADIRQMCHVNQYQSVGEVLNLNNSQMHHVSLLCHNIFKLFK